MLPYHPVVLKPQHLPVLMQTKPKTFSWNSPQPVRELCQLKPKEMVGWGCIILFLLCKTIKTDCGVIWVTYLLWYLLFITCFQMLQCQPVLLKPQHLVMQLAEPEPWNSLQPAIEVCYLNPKAMVSWECWDAKMDLLSAYLTTPIIYVVYSQNYISC